MSEWREGRECPSSALAVGSLASAADRAVLDPDEGRGVEVLAGGAADLARGDAGDPVGPVQGVVQRQAPALQLQQALGALVDGLVVEHPGAGEVAAGAVDLLVGEGSLM